MMMLSSSIAAVLFVVLTVLPVVVLECMIIFIVYCFICMVVFVLRITMVMWCSFRLCLTQWLDNWRRRQVNVAPWSTCFHLLF
jgi:hypothetical protein